MLVRFRHELNSATHHRFDLSLSNNGLDTTNYPPIGFIAASFHSTSFRLVPTARQSAVPPALVNRSQLTMGEPSVHHSTQAPPSFNLTPSQTHHVIIGQSSEAFDRFLNKLIIFEHMM